MLARSCGSRSPSPPSSPSAAAGAYAAFGRGDELGDLDVPEVATESGRAHHFDVRAFAEGFNRPTWVGGAPGDDALWVLEQPGRVLRLDGGRRSVALDLSGPRQARRRAGPARHRLPPRLRHGPPPVPALVGPEGRHARGRVPRPPRRHDRARAAARAAVRRPARGEPQRRPAAVRPRRAAVPRPRRRRRRVRPAPHGAGPRTAARQDPRRRRPRAGARAGTSC